MNSPNIHILAWNARDALSTESNYHSVRTVIDMHKPQFAVFPEAYRPGEGHKAEEYAASFKNLGYRAVLVPYDDADARADNRGLMALVQEGWIDGEPEVFRMAERNAIRCRLLNPQTGISFDAYGVHHNDRSPVQRMAEAACVIGNVDVSRPTVVVGDMNDVHPSSPRHWKLGVARMLDGLTRIGVLPVTDPENHAPKWSLGRLGSLATRLHAMSQGDTIRLYENHALLSADRERRATMPARAPFVQLDHILASQHFDISEFQILPAERGFDHRAILGKLAIGS